jgi:adenosylmethionine-8-amino-7-oxononanoate aminotransferase
MVETLKNYSNVGDYLHPAITSLSNLVAKICSKDDLRFTNSGSEASHLAVRLARAASGRVKVIKFLGHYHGWFSEEINTFLGVPVSTGVPIDYTQQVFPPFLMGPDRRTHADNCCFSFMFSFWAGVMLPSAMLGRSLLYVQSHSAA